MATLDLRTAVPQLLPLPGAAGKLASQLTASFIGVGDLERTYAPLRGAGNIAQGLLDSLAITYRISDAELNHIPKTGGVVVAANHPFGILEGAVLGAVLRRIRSDVKILASGVVEVIPELAGLVIPVDAATGKRPMAHRAGMRAAIRHLRNGGLLVVFPAGQVAQFDLGKLAVADPPWSPMIARLIRLGKAPSIVPVHISGSTNGPVFYAAGILHPALSSALLGRELLNKRNATVDLRVGRPVERAKLERFSTDDEQIQYLRWRADLLKRSQSFKQQTAKLSWGGAKKARAVDTIPPVNDECLAAEVLALPAGCLLEQNGELSVYLAQAHQIPHVLQEIGRLREVTFRAVGEGTGRSTDQDAYDGHYEHLFLWNAGRREVAGAYRLCRTNRGARWLYTSSLFGFQDAFLKALGPGVELGRSFIRKEYQRGFGPLLLLWKGIGRYVAAHPRYKVLFGAVSISNRYQAVSRELIISFLEERASLDELKSLVRPPNAPARVQAPAFCTDIEELSAIISDVEAGTPIPVLLRQYLKLGGKLVGFNVDAKFSRALDGLIVVDLMRTEPKLLERYLGKAEAATFLAFHRKAAE